MTRRVAHPPLLALVVALLGVSLCGVARAQRIEQLPEGMQGVGVDDKSGDQVPLDLQFRDENGKVLALGDVMNGSKPVLLSLNYSDCPMLCRVQLNGLVDALKEIEESVGRDFDVLSVSIDPTESTLRAKQTEQRYVKEYARPGSSEGWRFFTGSKKNIDQLADAVGFRYKFIPDTGEYSHSAATMVMTPDGVISRYFDDVLFDPPTLRLSLVEASEGKIGSSFDQLFLFCFHYDETRGRYGPVARRIMSLGAGVTVFAMAAGLLPYWLRRERGPTPTGPAPAADHQNTIAASAGPAAQAADAPTTNHEPPVSVG